MKIGSFNSALLFVSKELSENNRNDTIHDFLSFLAEKMIELNKQKQTEVKNFLEWLERELGVNYELNFKEFLDLLKKNQKKITKIYFGNRVVQENLKKEFENSISKLVPIMDKIQKIDKLIDNIVYKLYGLTKEEIEVVENRMKKEEKETEEDE